MIHLDVDVYPAIKFVLDEFWPRIARNGFILVDDYGFTTCKGAKKAVDEFFDGAKDCIKISSFDRTMHPDQNKLMRPSCAPR